MKNTYIKLFERLAKQKANALELIEKFSDLGFFLTDFERMHKEGFVFLDKMNELSDKEKKLYITKYYVKLAPKGFASLEEFNRNQRQEQINDKTLGATIIIATATALNVLIILFVFISNLEKSNWAKPVSLAVFGVLIAVFCGTLIKNITYFYSRGKKTV